MPVHVCGVETEVLKKKKEEKSYLDFPNVILRNARGQKLGERRLLFVFFLPPKADHLFLKKNPFFQLHHRTSF